MSIKYRETGEGGDFYENDEYVTVAVDRNDGIFGEAVYALMGQRHSPESRYSYPRPGAVLMTTEKKWSGYSEFTITSMWSEIVLTAPEWNLEERWESIPEFFKALAAVDSESM